MCRSPARIAGLLELARQLGNVSLTCKILGYSRDRFYLAVADDLAARARQAITHQVSPRSLEKCCKRNLKGMARESKSGANWRSE